MKSDMFPVVEQKGPAYLMAVISFETLEKRFSNMET